MSFYMPFRFLGPDTVPFANYYEFRRNFMYTVDPDGRIWRPFPESYEKVKKIISSISVYFAKEDCLDLPDLINETIYCEMGKSQAAIYKTMKKDLIAMISDMCGKCNKSGNCDMSCDNEVIAKNALVLSRKLHQIASGFYMNTMSEITDEGVEIDKTSIITLDENPKLELLIRTLHDIPLNKKVIVWTNYTYLVELITNRIAQEFGENFVMTCYGRQDAFKQVERFREGMSTFMVANPSKMGVGLNIQFSSYQMFFSNSYSWIQRDQAISRQHRKGQMEKVTVFDFVARGTIDENIIEALNKKEDLSISLSELARVLK
jgi:SNF2 family DNA or RNA helicase